MSVTLGDLVNELIDSARNAGIVDSDNDVYDLATKHRAIRAGLDRFIRDTKCTRQSDTIDLTIGSATLDFSDIEGFHSERLFKLWIDGSPPVQQVDIDDVLERQRNAPTDGTPTMVAFDEPQSGICWPTPDAATNLNLIWWPPIPEFTAGDDAIDDLEFDLPADLARDAVRCIGVIRLQGMQIENIPMTNPLRVDYETLVARVKGAGNLAGKTITRTSSRDFWSQDLDDFPPDREP